MKVTDAKSDSGGDNDDDGSIEIINMKTTSGYIFNPLTIQQQKVICECTGLIYRKNKLNLSEQSENMATQPPKVRMIKWDGNCFFRGMSVGLTGWEVGHLKIRQIVCEYIVTYGVYTGQFEGKY